MERRSGDSDRPRILTTFNEPIEESTFTLADVLLDQNAAWWGDEEAAVALIEEAIALADRGGYRHHQAALLNHHADLSHLMGREQEARKTLTEAVTIFADVDPGVQIAREEIFGPVVTIMPFDTEEEVLNYANCVRYGLSATVWTENLSRAHRVAAKLESGIVWINTWMLRDLRTPFGGMKDSGVGREGGFEALRFFTEEKNVCVKI